MNDGIKPCVIIPLYNHGTTIKPLIETLQKHLSCPVIIVDDGSDSITKQYLNIISNEYTDIIIMAHNKNRGKGAAFSTGIKIAKSMNLTHALQIDADGQHDASAAVVFFELAGENPAALICGFPDYDESVPKSRKNGRVVANTWAKIVTLSSAIKDSMCGFRVYPVEETCYVIDHSYIDNRMAFDIDILVHLYWNNCPVIFHSVMVTYPKDGISHFHIIRDNSRITAVFTRLFFGMIARLPMLIMRHIKNV
ncbi:hypothetical protein AGMMS50212_11980 [Spirochaetia bacterium]|nr:hypothetical protein AGMMS50212_11980 [Spirochaetia bacterium]